jgi:hypothetical protein
MRRSCSLTNPSPSKATAPKPVSPSSQATSLRQTALNDTPSFDVKTLYNANFPMITRCHSLEPFDVSVTTAKTPPRHTARALQPTIARSDKCLPWRPAVRILMSWVIR